MNLLNILKFGVEYKFTGLIAYKITAFLIKIILITAFIFASIEPFTMFIDHWQAFLNNEAKIDLYFMLWQVLLIAIYYTIAVLIEMFIAFVIIMPMVKKTIEEKTSRW